MSRKPEQDADIPEPDALDGAPHPRHTGALFGQQQAERAFLEAHTGGRLHHAWMLTGPRGVGKATLAWRIARFLLTLPDDEGGLFAPPAPPESLDTDPDHPVIRRMAALAEPRLFLCRRPWDDKARRLKQAITVDEVRRLKSFFALSAADGGRRVAIIDAADEMNNAAANALLKILEEPPARVTLLLVAHQPMRLLPTIRSRCRTLTCAPLSPDDLARAMSAAGFAPEGDVSALGALAGGSAGAAIRLMAGDGVGLYAALLDMLAARPRADRPAMIRLAESCTGKGNEARYDLVLRLIDILLHRLALTGASGAPTPAVTGGEGEILSRLSPDLPAARRWAETAALLADRSSHGRAVNLDPAAVILDMLLKIDQTAAPLRAA